MFKTVAAATLAGSLLLSGGAQAQDFPTRPVTMVIPFAAGGPQDTIGRIIAQRMTEVLGHRSWLKMSAAPAAWQDQSASPRRRLTATPWCSARSAPMRKTNRSIKNRSITRRPISRRLRSSPKRQSRL